MARTTFRLPVDRFDALIGLDVIASFLDLTVEAVDGLTEVTVELTGPADVVEGATAVEGQTWIITVPAPASGSGATFANGNVVNRNFGGSVIQAGNVYGAVIFNGSVSMGGGTMMGGQQFGHEPVRAVARVPSSSVLSAPITAGSVVTRGRMSSVKITGQSVDTHVEHADRVETNTSSGDTTIGRVESSVVVHTISGDIDVRSSGSMAMLRTTSGDIDFTAGKDGRVTASTTSGDVTVVRSGYRVSSRTSSVSGDIREW
ncbi:DUF4097 family beta strand repeat-containing protein [Nocardiopsis sp. YSL2]|uniref:DUF4097 family beta strand repeat-containing protein n=1 Tax=Nocardiopsis sp. YSL2 TaxID=2939492 RepID=UPI0026F438EC|nr:DUF4097 family beta strand repeat-containing protein [Nocardiopsis sp. YSL2]